MTSATLHFLKNTGRQKIYSKNHVGLLAMAPFLIEMCDRQLYMLHKKKKKSVNFFFPIKRVKKKKGRERMRERGREDTDKRIHFHIMFTW